MYKEIPFNFETETVINAEELT